MEQHLSQRMSSTNILHSLKKQRKEIIESLVGISISFISRISLAEVFHSSPLRAQCFEKSSMRSHKDCVRKEDFRKFGYHILRKMTYIRHQGIGISLATSFFW